MKTSKKGLVETLVLLLLVLVGLNIFPILGVFLYYEEPAMFIGKKVWEPYLVGWVFNIVVAMIMATYYVVSGYMGKDRSFKELLLDVVFILLSVLMSFVLVSYFVEWLL